MLILGMHSAAVAELPVHESYCQCRSAMAAAILRVNGRADVVPKGAGCALDPGHQTRLGNWIILNSIDSALRDQVDDAPLRIRAALDVALRRRQT
jgi:hypothetical protein